MTNLKKNNDIKIKKEHICVCICTYKRENQLRRLLKTLNTIDTSKRFTFSIVVVDNDYDKSAKSVVKEASINNKIEIKYCVEKEKNIAKARNCAIKYAECDYIAFIDDDEFPEKKWLVNLYNKCTINSVDGVLGPVKPYFDYIPPDWAIKGKFYERPELKDNQIVKWYEARTGNVLFRKKILNKGREPFDTKFSSAGEDVDFFRRYIADDKVFLWDPNAVVYESIPRSRCNKKYLIKRALLRGSNFKKHPTDRIVNLIKSIVAIPTYLLLLPSCLIIREYLLLKYLIKICDHFSRILSFLGMPIFNKRNI